MFRSAVNDIPIVRVNGNAQTTTNDLLAAEEPLEIRLIYGPTDHRVQKNISVTMRTPGDDLDLAIGFLFTEGIIDNIGQVDNSFSFACAEQQENTITISLGQNVMPDIDKLERHFYTTSSCGVCGKSSISAVKVNVKKQEEDNIKVPASLFHTLPNLLREQQSVFESTGGLHASALFDLSGTLTYLKEDVGRHNALDKLIGKALQEDKVPLGNHILLLSGRASFELIQKAAVAGIKIVAAVGAPSSLAVELAKECHITILGFLRNERFNIYSGMQRVII